MPPLDEPRFALCLDNTSYPASLERRKAYQILPDAQAEQHHSLRVIDESGEDYLYPADCFVILELPQITRSALLAPEAPQKSGK